MTTSSQVFQVIMSPQVTDDLDHALCPSDGIVAIDALHMELSAVHVALTGKAPRKIHDWPRRARVYRGTFDVLPATFVYVALEGCLHVIGARALYADEDVTEYECVIPTSAACDALFAPEHDPAPLCASANDAVDLSSEITF